MNVSNVMFQPTLFIYSLPYIATLTVKQSHKLILAAYGQVGGISLATMLVDEPSMESFIEFIPIQMHGN